MATSPTRVVIMIAAVTRADRTASHSISSTAPIMTEAISTARSARLANSSSDRGTGPVRRTVTPFSGVRPASRATLRMASLTSAPGSRAL